MTKTKQQQQQLWQDIPFLTLSDFSTLIRNSDTDKEYYGSTTSSKKEEDIQKAIQLYENAIDQEWNRVFMTPNDPAPFVKFVIMKKKTKLVVVCY
mmetsp:Transcript_32608/g.48277  ORF Transcript_32608/g.48277 Transcript_32608/m.48277 type:complete len:95 (+) Transcript_32608:3-287(+)